MRILQRIIVLLLVGFLAGCAAREANTTAAFQNQSAYQIYQSGQSALAKKRYSAVIKHFEALDTLYPFSPYSERADLDLIYAYYQHDAVPSAEAAADRFTHLYPRSCYVDYAYYMKGLADYEQDRGWTQKYFPTDLSQRDPGNGRQAFNDFGILIRMFPDSMYAPDARQHMVYLRNLYALYELHVANYYFRHGSFVASANRASFILQHFDGTPAVQPALLVLYHSYQNLGLNDLASQVNTVYHYNYG